MPGYPETFGSSGKFNPKTGEYEQYKETTLLDPSAIVTQRHGRTDVTELEPYGSRQTDAHVAGARSDSWRQPQRHMLDREDV